MKLISVILLCVMMAVPVSAGEAPALNQQLVGLQEKLEIEAIRLENINLKYELVNIRGQKMLEQWISDQQNELKQEFAVINNIIKDLKANIAKVQKQIKEKAKQ